MKAKKRYTVAEHAFGIFYLAFVCAGIWIVSVTRPASLFLVVSSCLYIYAKNWKEEWIRGLAPFLGAVTIGFLLVWIAGIFLKFNEPNVDANRILAVEDAILETHETFKSVTHFGWGAYIAVLAILGIVSYYLPRTKLVSRFVTAKRWIESVVIAGTIITSFTFVSDAVVWTPGAEAVQEHFNEAYWRAEHRREDAITARAALVALVADRQVIVKLTAADFNALREKIGLKLYNPEHPATWRKRVEEEVPMPRSLASFWREMSDKPHTHEQVISARRAARGAEKLVREEEAALASIVEEVARQPKDVLTDIIVDYIVHVSATEFAKLLADKVVDAAWERLTSKKIENLSDRIVESLRERVQSEQTFAGGEIGSAVRELLAYKALLERQAERAEDLREAVKGGDDQRIASALTEYHFVSTLINEMPHRAEWRSDPAFALLVADVQTLETQARIEPQVLQRAESARVHIEIEKRAKEELE